MFGVRARVLCFDLPRLEGHIRGDAVGARLEACGRPLIGDRLAALLERDRVRLNPHSRCMRDLRTDGAPGALRDRLTGDLLDGVVRGGLGGRSGGRDDGCGEGNRDKGGFGFGRGRDSTSPSLSRGQNCSNLVATWLSIWSWWARAGQRLPQVIQVPRTVRGRV